MTLALFEGFDHANYEAPMLTEDDWAKMAFDSQQPGSGRRCGVSVPITSGGGIGRYLEYRVPAHAVVAVGFNVHRHHATKPFAVRFYGDGGGSLIHVYLKFTIDQAIEVYRGDGLLLGATANGVLSETGFKYLEARVLVHASAGTVTLTLEGNPLLALTGVSTYNGGAATINYVIIGSADNTELGNIDDLYIVNGAGSAPFNDLLGPVDIASYFPFFDGSTTDFVPLAGSNESNVSDRVFGGTNDLPNETDYNATSTAGAVDVFTLGPGQAFEEILSVKSLIYAKGSGTVQNVIRTPGGDQLSSAITLSSSYAYRKTNYQTDPSTGLAWEPTDVRGYEWGYKAATASSEIRVAQYAVEVLGRGLRCGPPGWSIGRVVFG